MITIKDILQLQNDLPANMVISGNKRNTKLMFHNIADDADKVNPRYDIAAFEDFQKDHWNRLFAGTEYVLSFWYENNVAEFVGVYELGEAYIDEVMDEKLQKNRLRYTFTNMKAIPLMAKYKHRLLINWTHPTQNYGRWIDDDKYEVHSILPAKNNCIGRLPSNYFNIQLTYQQLRHLHEYPMDNPKWKNYLANRSGVYLIVDKSTGEQYIGSAYGTNGFWGRWEIYALNGHGGNKELISKEPSSFQFSILWETLNTTPMDDIISVESQFKENLGTRTHGLNAN